LAWRLCRDFSTMTLQQFRATVSQGSPPAVSDALRALWYAARGDWNKAHQLAQATDTAAGAWVHAHLHRQEGDQANARYWYGKANQPEATDALESEWSRIVTELLDA